MMTNPADPLDEQVQSRTKTLFEAHRQRIFQYTDRLFVVLMIFQWIGGIILALVVSPRTWIGTASGTNIHVWVAIFLGGGIASLPVALGILMPGRTITRYVIAVGQMLFSALLIHLTGGRIETHFHVFGSLAFLAFYRDWKVFVPATIIVGVDHMVRGIFWPQSVFGILAVSPWRWIEHVAWVVFEDIFLIISCQRSIKEMREIAKGRAALEINNELLEAKVKERIRELLETQEELKHTARLADIGTLAAIVAHELRNPLVSMGLAADNIKKKAYNRDIDKYVVNIDKKVAESHHIIDNLLSYSRLKPPQYEKVRIFDILNECAADCLENNDGKKIIKVMEFDALKDVLIEADPTQIKQVFTNILNNACDAVADGQGRIKVTGQIEDTGIKISIEDNGPGMERGVLNKIFQPFFTTKQKGTGLGLAICRQIIGMHGGAIQIESQPGKGSSFIVHLRRGKNDPIVELYCSEGRSLL